MNKEKVKSKVWDNSEELKQELQRIADELGLPIDDEKVGLVWTRDGQSFTHEVYKEVLEPLYFTLGQKKDTSCESSS